MTCVYPPNRAGALFVKTGAIIPCWPEMDYVGERPIETVELEVYPEGKSAFTMYEDDGNSLEYLKGAVAETVIQCEAANGEVRLSVAPRVGTYRDMPSRRDYDIRVHAARPKSVAVDGKDAHWAYEAGIVCLNASEDASRKTPIVIEIAM